MTFSCETSIKDMEEASCRLFFRSRMAKRNAIVSAIIGATAAGGTVFILSRLLSLPLGGNQYVLYPIAVGLGAIVAFFRYKPVVRKRIRKYCEEHLEGRTSALSTYTLEGDSVRVEWDETTTSFLLRNLRGVSVDEEWIELYFGMKGLFLIPLRAFESIGQKEQFLAQVRASGGMLGK